MENNYSHYKVQGWINSLTTLNWVCDYLSVLGLKLNHVSKRGPSYKAHYTIEHNPVLFEMLHYIMIIFISKQYLFVHMAQS